MAEFGLILDHPGSKEVLSKLLSGSTPKEVAQWLKLKYPEKDQSHLRLTQKLLKEFKDSQFTDFLPQFQQDLAEVSANNSDDKYMSAALTNIKPYRERMKEIANVQLNTLVTLEKNIAIVLTRFEQMYDLIQQNPTEAKFDNTFLRYISAIKDGFESIEKMKANSPDHLSQHNFTMQMLQDYINAFQEAIRETMAEVEPEVASLFMEKLYNKIDNLQAPLSTTPEQQQTEAQRFEAHVVSVVDSDDS